MKARRFIRQFTVATVRTSVVAMAVCAASCAGSCSNETPVPKDLGSDLGDWAIHFYGGVPVRRFDIAPAALNGSDTSAQVPPVPTHLKLPDAFRRAAAASPTPANKALPTTKEVVAATPDGGVTVTGANLSDERAWWLLAGAAYECGLGREQGTCSTGACSGPPKAVIMPPWKARPEAPNPWFIFPAPAQSCDEQLQRQQIMLCMADKLDEVADAVGNVTWSKVPSDASSIPAPFTIPEGPWTFPPQAEKDRFIARDLAIYTLANLALTDMAQPTGDMGPDMNGGTFPKSVCSEAYARATADAKYAKRNRKFLFDLDLPIGSEEADDTRLKDDKFNLSQKVDLTDDNARNIGGFRLLMEAHILRSGGRLLEDLIQKSVLSDLAGAERRRARATDPRRGNELVWAQNATAPDGSDARYNSLAHAVRVLEGRWELGPGMPPTVPDPKCGGLAPMELLRGAYGPDLTARQLDYPVVTKEQRLALAAVQTSGIVVPDTVAAGKDGATLKKAVTDQLVATAAAREGYSSVSAVEDTRKKSIAEAMAGVSEADLRFALHQTYNAYRQLATTPDAPIPSTGPEGGMVKAPIVAASVSALGGATAVKVAVPKGDLAGPTRARTAGLAEASQCNNWGGGWGAIYADWAFSPTFQNSFAIGQTFWRRLTVIREVSRDIAGLTSKQEAGSVADLAAAEHRTWAGPGQFASYGIPAEGGLFVGGVEMLAYGLDLSDYGVNTADEAGDRLALVYGEPGLADCVAGTRETCPDDLADYVTYPKYASKLDYLTPRESGTDGVGYYLQFDAPGKGSTGKPMFLGATPNTTGKHVYVVLRRDPKATGSSPVPTKARGKVLGTIAFRTSWEVTVSIVSSLQAELLDGVLGVGDKVSSVLSSKGDTSTAYSPSYCIKNVARNLLVPLENEITGDSDAFENSWKHYLQLAEKAAAKADELGEKMVTQGLTSDLRREAAQEELARTCGKYTNLDEISTAKGKVVPPADDAAMKSCLSGDNVDVVLLTKEPKGLVGLVDSDTKDERTVWLKLNVLKCPTSPTTPPTPPSFLPSENDLCGKSRLTFAALGIAGEYEDEAAPSAAACEKVRTIGTSLASAAFDADGLGKLGLEGFMSTSKLRDRVSGLRLSSGITSSGKLAFRLEASGATLLDSADPVIWPGCQRTSPSTCDPAKNPAIEVFRPLLLEEKSTTAVLDDDDMGRMLWQLQGAVYTLAGWSGSVPAGVFSHPVVAADLAAPGWTGDPSVPAPTLFGGSRFAAGALGAMQFDTTGGNTGNTTDIAIMAGSRPLTFKWTALSRPVLPTWLGALYASPDNRYREVDAVNDEIAGTIDADGKRGNVLTTSTLAAWLGETAQKFKGLSCKGTSANSVSYSTGSTVPSHSAGQKAVALRKQPDGRIRVCGTGGGWAPTLELKLDGQIVTGSTFSDKMYYLVSKDDWSGEEDDDYRAACKGFEGNDPENATNQTNIVPLYPAGSVDHDYKADGVEVAAVCGRFEDRGVPGELTSICSYSNVNGVRQVPKSCAVDGHVAKSTYGASRYHGYRQYTQRITLPQVCTPGQRVQAYVNAYGPKTACAAVGELTIAAALACELGQVNAFPISPEPPKIETRDDMAALARWLGEASKRIRRQASRVHLERIPAAVVKDLREGTVTPAIGGDMGAKRMEMGQSINGIATTLIQASEQVGAIKSALDMAYLTVKGVDYRNKIDQLNLLRSRISIYRDISDRAARAVGGIAGLLSGGGAGEAATGAGAVASGIYWGEKELGALATLSEATGDEKINEVNKALNLLQDNLRKSFGTLNTQLLQLRTSVSQSLAIGKTLASLEAKAQYEAAKGAGLDYFVDPATGKALPIPVNTVQRRMFDITKRRYDRALIDAKYLAYVARLAIEQRIGQRLDTITTPVGALPPPQQWADDVCSLEGVDYAKLRKAGDVGGTGKDGGDPVIDEKEKSVIRDFANAYVGDYVAKLGLFVEYYNIQYPSHEGDDVAVLSLQDDLGGCMTEAPNLLVQSCQLSRSSTKDGQTIGWRANACILSGTKCVRTATGTTVPTPPAPPVVSTLGGFTWLYDGGADSWTTPPPSSPPPLGPASPTPPPSSTPVVKPVTPPAHSVGQLVTLKPGTHVLSWWDMARAADGGAATAATVVRYRGAVYDSKGAAIAMFTEVPFYDGKNGWSPRRSLSFSVDSAGTYVVAFSPSLDDPSESGSLLVANVQLERDEKSAGASEYVGTEWSRLRLTTQCPAGSKAKVQTKFEHRCENDVCFHELVAPLLIDTAPLSAAKGALVGKLASENFNFRHMTVSVNLVGTGVRDCTKTPTPSCYGSGYLEYTLQHDAYNAGIVGWDGAAQFFNFGGAAIRHGKALAAERYITLPIGSADSGLLFTPATEKVELRGRPLDGSYRFRIFDQEALRWERLEDVQFVLKYRYWSAIQPQPPGT